MRGTIHPTRFTHGCQGEPRPGRTPPRRIVPLFGNTHTHTLEGWIPAFCCTFLQEGGCNQNQNLLPLPRLAGCRNPIQPTDHPHLDFSRENDSRSHRFYRRRCHAGPGRPGSPSCFSMLLLLLLRQQQQPRRQRKLVTSSSFLRSSHHGVNISIAARR